MQCPSCGYQNRAGAKFCAGCRAPLTGGQVAIAPTRLPAPRPGGGATAKICPHCAQEMPVSARICSQCGYTFLSSPARGRGFRFRAWHFWGAMACVGVLLLWGALRPQTASQSPAAWTPVARSPAAQADMLAQALSATVQLMTESRGGRVSTGSGAILSSSGMILTNFHVIGDVERRRLYNDQGMIWVGISPPGSNRPPVSQYVANLIDADYDLDLALVQIVTLADGSPLPADLALPTVAVGDSDTVTIGDQLRIIGYPGLGGATVTLTTGIVAGFLPEGWIKTDAEINPGNSGGVALNGRGELVGIPTAGNVGDSYPGKLGLIRPINLAQPLWVRAADR